MSFTVNGVAGVLHLIACLLFLIAAIVAWFVSGEPARPWHPRLWPTFIAAGLCLWVLATLLH